MDLKRIQQQLSIGRSIFDLELRVAYYARVSSDKDEQLNSLENQIIYYDDFICRNKNWTPAGTYIDEGISGTSVDKRDDFLRMVADGEKGLFDLIITKSISRFARDTLDSLQYTRKLYENGVGVFFEQDNLNTLMPDSEMRLAIMASMAQDEMRRLSANVKFGIKRAYEAGRVLGQNNMYGYNKEKGKLTINEEQAPFIRSLYSLYAEGKYGLRTIARLLYEMGYRNQAGGELNPGTLRQILENPKYKGYYHGRKTESSDYRIKKNVKLARDEQLLYKDGNIPALVSEELWDKVNSLLADRREKYKKHSSGTQSRFSYSGKIICGEHGVFHYRKLWKGRKTSTEGWCCKEYLARGRAACPTPHIYTRDLDNILEQIGCAILSSRERYSQAVKQLIDLYRRSEQSRPDKTAEIEKLSCEISKQKRKADKLLELYTEGSLDKPEYLEKNERIRDAERRLKERLQTIDGERNAGVCPEEIFENARKCFYELADNNGAVLQVARAMLGSVTVLNGSVSNDIRLRIAMKYKDIHHARIIKLSTLISYIETEVSPVVGTEKQSEELVRYLLSEFESDPAKIWQTNIFGKSLHELVKEGLSNKLSRMPEDAQLKIAETLQRIINEGSGGLLCILL